MKELRSIGIQPDILLCRSDREVPKGERKKIALFCNVREEAVIQALDAASIYDVPLAYHREGLDEQVLEAFGITGAPKPDLTRWETISRGIASPEGEVTIAIVGKMCIRDRRGRWRYMRSRPKSRAPSASRATTRSTCTD